MLELGLSDWTRSRAWFVMYFPLWFGDLVPTILTLCYDWDTTQLLNNWALLLEASMLVDSINAEARGQVIEPGVVPDLVLISTFWFACLVKHHKHCLIIFPFWVGQIALGTFYWMFDTLWQYMWAYDAVGVLSYLLTTVGGIFFTSFM